MTDYDGGRMLARQGRAHGFMQSVLPDLSEAKTYTAPSIDCSNLECGVLAGTACEGPRVCTERLDIAINLMRSGELDELPEVVVAVDDSTEEDDVASCQRCGLQRNSRGSPLACGHRHQCQRRLTGGLRCKRERKADDQYCTSHQAMPRRWC